MPPTAVPTPTAPPAEVFTLSPAGTDPAADLAGLLARAVADGLKPLADVAADPDPLTVRPKVAARMLGIARKTLDTLNNAGKTPAPLRIGGSVVYRTADLAEWVRLGCPDRAEYEARTRPDADRPGTRRKAR